MVLTTFLYSSDDYIWTIIKITYHKMFFFFCKNVLGIPFTVLQVACNRSMNDVLVFYKRS